MAKCPINRYEELIQNLTDQARVLIKGEPDKDNRAEMAAAHDLLAQRLAVEDKDHVKGMDSTKRFGDIDPDVEAASTEDLVPGENMPAGDYDFFVDIPDGETPQTVIDDINESDDIEIKVAKLAPESQVPFRAMSISRSEAEQLSRSAMDAHKAEGTWTPFPKRPFFLTDSLAAGLKESNEAAARAIALDPEIAAKQIEAFIEAEAERLNNLPEPRTAPGLKRYWDGLNAGLKDRIIKNQLVPRLRARVLEPEELNDSDIGEAVNIIRDHEMFGRPLKLRDGAADLFERIKDQLKERPKEPVPDSPTPDRPKPDKPDEERPLEDKVDLFADLWEDLQRRMDTFNEVADEYLEELSQSPITTESDRREAAEDIEVVEDIIEQAQSMPTSQEAAEAFNDSVDAADQQIERSQKKTAAKQEAAMGPDGPMTGFQIFETQGKLQRDSRRTLRGFQELAQLGIEIFGGEGTGGFGGGGMFGGGGLGGGGLGGLLGGLGGAGGAGGAGGGAPAGGATAPPGASATATTEPPPEEPPEEEPTEGEPAAESDVVREARAIAKRNWEQLISREDTPADLRFPQDVTTLIEAALAMPEQTVDRLILETLQGNLIEHGELLATQLDRLGEIQDPATRELRERIINNQRRFLQSMFVYLSEVV